MCDFEFLLIQLDLLFKYLFEDPVTLELHNYNSDEESDEGRDFIVVDIANIEDLSESPTSSVSGNEFKTD